MLLHPSSSEFVTSLKTAGGRRRLLMACVFLIAILGTALTPRPSTLTLFTWYGIAFILYLFCIAEQQSWRLWLFMGILVRFALLFVFPHLSDDVYRFFWDGNLSLDGINPFSRIPSDVMASGTLSPAMQTTFTQLNSPDYYTVYPVICQFFFAIAAWIGGDDVTIFAIILKAIFFLFECGTLYWLYRILNDENKPAYITLYALNPLVLIELIGNLHCEGVMIFFLVLMYRSLGKGRIMQAAGMLSLAIATKVIPVLCIPLLLRRLRITQFFVFTGMVVLATGLFFIPVFTTSQAQGYLSSLDLYFRQFEFNAGFYYVGRWIGYLQKGFNTIATTGPLLALLTVITLSLYLLLEKRPRFQNFPVALLFALTTYFFFATTVHPWYACTLVALSTLTPFRYPVAWSGMIFFTYAAYRSDAVDEISWLIGLEYAVVIGWAAIEWWRHFRKVGSPPSLR